MKVDTEEGPLGDRRGSKPVSLVMRKRGDGWKRKECGNTMEMKIDGGEQKIIGGMEEHTRQDGGQPVTKK